MTYPSGVGVFSPKIRDASVVRRFVSRNGYGYLSLGVLKGQTPIDPDVDTVKLKVFYNAGVESDEDDDPRGDLIINVDDHSGTDIVKKEEVGKFYYDIGPDHTQNRGVLTAEWTYQVDGKDFMFTDFIQILDQMPIYDGLSEQSKFVISMISLMFGDLFDSTEGGPWNQENFQTHFDYEKLAILLMSAIGRINFYGQPPTNYGLGPQDQPLPKEWSQLLVWALRLEVIRHLMRSYTEIPDFRNMNVTYTDRRDYAQRWKMILDEEKPDLEKAIIMAKRSLLSLARGALLVSGGYFSVGGGGIFIPGMQVAAQRSFRFYPAAPSVSFGFQAASGR